MVTDLTLKTAGTEAELSSWLMRILESGWKSSNPI